MAAWSRWYVDQRAIGVITGEVGAGKTVAVRAATTALDPSRHVFIYLANPTLGVRGMLTHIVATLGHTPAFHKSTLAPQASEALATEHAERGRSFRIDLAGRTVTCPADHTVSIRAGVRHPVARFGVLCQSCPLRAQCTKSRRGRVISIHPREAALQHAKARQRDPAWQQDYRTYRPVVESFDFAEPALVLRFGDAGFEVVSDLNEPGALVGVGP